MKKRLLSLFLSLALIAGALPTAYAVSMPAPEWASSAYQRMDQEGYYSFPSSGTITRAEFLDLLMTALQLVLSPDYMDSLPQVADDYFVDNPRDGSASYYPDNIYKAAACGITRQTYSGYESGERYPKKKEMYQVLADFFEVDVTYLYTDKEMFLDAAHEQYGSRGMAQAQELVSQLAGMFAGGELSDQDREAVMRSLERAYWLAKEDNQKYTPKKYRK